MAPAVQSVLEDGTAIIRGVSVYDADVISAAVSQYEVTVSMSNGLVNLYASSSEATTATSTPTASITHTASIESINSLLQHITYQPKQDYNELQSSENLVVQVRDLSGDTPSEYVSVSVPISVQAENDAPLFVVPHQQQITLTGFALSNVDTLNSTSVTATLSVDNSMASLLVSASAGVTFVEGSAGAYSRSVQLQGSLNDVSAALGTLKYMRNSTAKDVIDGGDSITVQVRLEERNRHIHQRPPNLILPPAFPPFPLLAQLRLTTAVLLPILSWTSPSLITSPPLERGLSFPPSLPTTARASVVPL
jgi:hypothetical protein